jgi:alpha-tubulin suppressor-like RCC1 family protein
MINAPSNLSAIAVSGSEVNLSWADNSNNEDGFEIYRSTDGTNYELLTTTNADTTFYSDPGQFLPFIIYYYRVRSFNTIGDRSAWSNIASVSSPIPIPVWSALAAGESHSIALAADGTLWGWGDNQFGQLDPSNYAFTITIPTLLGMDADWSRIAAGYNHTLAIKTNQTLWSWGANEDGRLGLGNTDYPPSPTPVGTNSDWNIVAGGTYHSIALKNNPAGGGTLWSWGGNDDGQLGLGDTGITRTTPTQIGTNSDWFTITAGGRHNLAIKTNRTLWAWGWGFWGQLGDGSGDSMGQGDNIFRTTPRSIGTNSDWSAVSASYLGTVGLKTNRTLWLWGAFYTEIPEQIGADTDWQSILSGGYDEITIYTLALKTNGTLWTWGFNNYGQLGVGDRNDRTTPTLIGQDSDWQTFSAGGYHVIALKTNGNIWVWGGNQYYQLGSGDTLDRYIPSPLGSPVSPSSLNATVISSSQINLSWTDSSYNETGFKIERKTGITGTWETIATVGFNVTSYSNTGLTLGVPYYYQVSAYNSFGDSSLSNEKVITPILFAPTNLNLIVISSSQINLSWTDNSPDEAGFEIQRKIGLTGTWDTTFTVNANATIFSNITVLGGNPYYRVRAYNAFGNSAWSNEPTPVLFAPSPLILSVVSSTQINLFWTYNSSEEVGFKIERKTGAGGSYSQIATPTADTTFYPDTTVTPGNTYYYRVRAYNAFTNSGYSNELTPVLSAPSPLTLSVVSSTQVNLFWTYNSSEEAGFKIERKTGVGGSYSQIATPTADTTFYPDTTVTPGDTYYYRVRAYNDFVNSQYSNEANTALSAPSLLSLSVISSTQIDLLWQDNSSDELGLQIERKIGLTGTWSTTFTAGANVTIYSDTTVTSGNTYYYRVRAYNDFGNSQYSNEANTALSAPSSLSLIVISSTQFDLSWQDNSSSEAGFQIERKIERDGTYQQIGTTNANIITYTDTTTTGFAPNSTYYYRVKTSNAFGESSYSNESGAAISGNWSLIAAGQYHTLALKTNRVLWAWGVNWSGRLGLGDSINRLTPSQVGTGTDWSVVAAGQSHSIALKTSGTLWAWGNYTYGQLGLGLGNTIDRNTPSQVNSQTDWSAVVCRKLHTFAIKTDRTLWAWGYNYYAQLGLGNSIDRNTPTAVGTQSDWSGIAAGIYHTLGFKDNGTIWSWGNYPYGALGLGDFEPRNTPSQIGIDSDWSNTITAGLYYSFARKTNGTLWAWGNNSYGQLGLGDTINRNTPSQVGMGTDWSVVVAGESHTIALKTNTTLWAWGLNSVGQLGLGDNTLRITPSQLGTQSDGAMIAAGDHYTLVIKTSGTLWAWGQNNNGQLGLGDTINRNVPTLVGE